MTDRELQTRMLDAIANLPGRWNRELTIEDLQGLNQIWHEWMYEAKGDVCDHPERDRWQGHCFKCGRNVEVKQASK